MPWKEGYTISDEIGLRDDEVRWPNGMQCAATMTVDLSLASGPAGITAADMQTSTAIFGLHDGIDQLRKLLDRFEIKATIAVPAAMARFLGETLRSLRADGHEIAAQGLFHEDVSGLARADEQDRMERATEILTDVVGERPMGWFSLARQNDTYAGGAISPNTMDLLIEGGYRYMGNSLSDDIPHYWVTDFDTRRVILALPYYYHFDDQFFLMFPRKGTGLEHADALAANWRAEFDAQYKRGRLFNMTLHPYLIGWAHRIKLLEDFLAHMRASAGVWNPTGGQCAEYWLDAYPASTTLKLEPSIWKDYPGSLS